MAGNLYSCILNQTVVECNNFSGKEKVLPASPAVVLQRIEAKTMA